MTAVRKAVIVAAGQSSRLRPLTDATPKCLLRVGEQTMIDRSIALLRQAGVSEIAVVVGFEREKIQNHLGTDGVTYLSNPFFRVTNNLASLWFARSWVENDAFLYLHSDIIYDSSVLAALVAQSQPEHVALLVDSGPSDHEAMKVRVAAGRFVESSKEVPIEESAGEWVGIALFPSSGPAVDRLFRHAERVFDEVSCNAYDTAAFNRMAREGIAFQIVDTAGAPWIEIDDSKDLERARGLFG